MAMYKTRNGVEVKVTRREMKRTIMQAHNWTEEQYRKQYDIFKNKLRFYESVQRSRDIKGVEKQSPQELLYRQVRNMIKYGKDYEPSQSMAAIMSTTAHSITKGRKIAAAGKGASYKRAVSKIVNIRFQGVVDHYEKAKEIVAKIQDPVKQEEALVAFLTELHKKNPRAGKDAGAPKKGEGGISYGETFGSGNADEGEDFDISEWLDEESEE